MTTLKHGESTHASHHVFVVDWWDDRKAEAGIEVWDAAHAANERRNILRAEGKLADVKPRLVRHGA